MKKAYLFLFAAACFTCTRISAQNDAGAKKVLDGVSAKVRASKGITASITLKAATSKGKEKGSQTGTLSMKGNRYLLKKGGTEIINDGSKVYTYDAANKTITVASAEDNGSSLNPQKLLTGAYESDFKYRLVATKGNICQIEMIPADSRKNFQKADLFIDKTKNMITRAVITDKGNNTTELLISNLNTNASLPDNLFVFNKGKYPPDVEVLD